MNYLLIFMALSLTYYVESACVYMPSSWASPIPVINQPVSINGTSITLAESGPLSMTAYVMLPATNSSANVTGVNSSNANPVNPHEDNANPVNPHEDNANPGPDATMPNDDTDMNPNTNASTNTSASESSGYSYRLLSSPTPYENITLDISTSVCSENPQLGNIRLSPAVQLFLGGNTSSSIQLSIDVQPQQNGPNQTIPYNEMCIAEVIVYNNNSAPRYSCISNFNEQYHASANITTVPIVNCPNGVANYRTCSYDINGVEVVFYTAIISGPSPVLTSPLTVTASVGVYGFTLLTCILGVLAVLMLV